MPPSKPRTAAPKCARCGHAKTKHTRRMGCAVTTGHDRYCSCLKYMADSAAILAEANAWEEIEQDEAAEYAVAQAGEEAADAVDRQVAGPDEPADPDELMLRAGFTQEYDDPPERLDHGRYSL